MAGAFFNRTSKSGDTKNIQVSGDNRIGIVDIGSNTIRLVVFDAPARLPVPIFNERITCGLGKGLGLTGQLNPSGADLAIRTLGRFTRLAREMQVEHFVLVATAAVREANNGTMFVEEVKRRFGHSVKVLSGVEEARLGAMGILGGSPEAQGVAGDLGGGSLDLISFEKGTFGESDTLPLGHLRVGEDSNRNLKRAKDLIANNFNSLSWLGSTPGRSLYAIGGACRTIARLYIEQTKYPLHVIDNFTIEYNEALSFTSLIGGLSARSLAKMGDVTRRRADTLPYAALVLNNLIQLCQPKELIFSGYGLREGIFYEHLTKKMKEEDPLISACEGFAIRSGRFSIHGEEIVSWLAPLFLEEARNFYRIFHAGILLSDIGWTEHPDYRAIHSFMRVLRLPISGISHRQRIMLALTVYVRYNGKRRQYEVQQVRDLLTKKDQHRARVMGVALRFAHLISGGVPGVLPCVNLKVYDETLRLSVDGSDRDLISESVERLFYELADTLNLLGEIK
ncbi:MAG TPA: Ppx/GppA family phosphatase [Rhodospirillales bacterium]|nr:Ppx/GppA family phosphatase [Rhodospirillales bacterium]